jgi:hypothetical protein
MNLTRTFAAFSATLALTASIAIAAPTTITIPMKALNGSGESGTATLTQTTPTDITVTISLKNAPATIAQPSHVHIGPCAKINPAPVNLLTNVVDGKSTTVVKGVTLAKLLAGHFALNVHKSADALGVYVSCGNIVAPK